MVEANRSIATSKAFYHLTIARHILGDDLFIAHMVFDNRRISDKHTGDDQHPKD